MIESMYSIYITMFFLGIGVYIADILNSRSYDYELEVTQQEPVISLEASKKENMGGCDLPKERSLDAAQLRKSSILAKAKTYDGVWASSLHNLNVISHVFPANELNISVIVSSASYCKGDIIKFRAHSTICIVDQVRIHMYGIKLDLQKVDGDLSNIKSGDIIYHDGSMFEQQEDNNLQINFK